MSCQRVFKRIKVVQIVAGGQNGQRFVDGSPSETRQGSADTEDFATYAFAEIERRRTPPEGKAAPRVSYREQNGIATFSQIETDELILRFTPIPLGLAK